MASDALDFAVFGASPLAGLVAGLLAGRHGKSVVLIAEPEVRFRLPRSMDLSIAPITRPETWALLTRAIPETRKLITGMGGKAATRRINPVLFSDGAAGKEALGHIAHMARANGLLIDRISKEKAGGNRSAFRVSDVFLLDRHTLSGPLERWLSVQNVVRVAPDTAVLKADGTTEARSGENTIQAKRSILVDDAAILSHLPHERWPEGLKPLPHASVLTAANGRLAGEVMFDLDSGTTLIDLDAGSIAATGPGTLARFSARLPHLLAENGVTQQIGQSGFEAPFSMNGAPIVGSLEPESPILLTGLGPTGAFLAPTLARWLAGEASPKEAAWCAARRPLSPDARRGVAEFVAQPLESLA